MATTAERLRAVKAKAEHALDVVQGDNGASPVLVAVVGEFAKKAAKAVSSEDENVAVVELEQAGDSAKAAAEADPGIDAATRDVVLDAHLSICIAKGKLGG